MHDGVIGISDSVCPQCRVLVPAKVLVRDGRVFLLKHCPTHGSSEAEVHGSAEDYLKAQRFAVPAYVPRGFRGNRNIPCPQGCGFCQRHEQHLCMPIIEITSRCNLWCPVCINSSGQTNEPDLTPHEFKAILDSLLQLEPQIDVLNISGGEPLMHPDLLEIIDEAQRREKIIRVSISTNGLLLLDNDDLLERLTRRNVVISLQFDGWADEPYLILRGRPLLQQKLTILEKLKQSGITMSLTMTASAGVSENQFRPMLDYFFSSPHVISLMIQPIAFAGRAAGMDVNRHRLTIPDVIHLLTDAGHQAVNANDFLPLPCSHPLCFSLAFYLVVDGCRTVAVNRLTQAENMLDSLANRMFFGLAADEYEQLKEMIYRLWSGPAGAVPDSEAVLATLRAVLQQLSACGRFDPRQCFSVMERKVKSIFIHAFQDAWTFDLARVRRCCQAYPQRDGSLIPACVRNVRAGTQQ